MTYVSETVHFTFETYLAATEALLVVMTDARETPRKYRIIGRSPERLILGGLTLEGEIQEISEKVAAISGATRRFG